QLVHSDTNDALPAWSPDGRKLAFDRIDDTGTDQIYIANANGSGSRKVSHGFLPTGVPRWAPDGNALVVTHPRGPTLDIYSLALPSGRLRRLGGTAADDASPDMAPDGRHFVFVSGNGGSGTLVVGSADGSPQRVVAAGPGYSDPAWSPDGRTIAAIQDGKLVLVDASSGRVTEIKA